MDRAYPDRAVIVDQDLQAKRQRPGAALLMPLAIGALAIAFGALVLRPAADPEDATRARERLLAALALPTKAPATQAPAIQRPSVLAQRTARPAPPLLTLPAEVAAPVADGTSDAFRATLITVGSSSRQGVYKLGDGRMLVLLQTPSDRRRLVLGSYGFEEGTIRGQPAQFYTSYLGTLRSIISWTESGAGYHLYSASLTVRELVRMAEQLR